MDKKQMLLLTVETQLSLVTAAELAPICTRRPSSFQFVYKKNREREKEKNNIMSITIAKNGEDHLCEEQMLCSVSMQVNCLVLGHSSEN